MRHKRIIAIAHVCVRADVIGCTTNKGRASRRIAPCNIFGCLVRMKWVMTQAAQYKSNSMYAMKIKGKNNMTLLSLLEKVQESTRPGSGSTQVAM